jgi:NADH-quinone oxidoreductase subunit G
VRALSEVLGVRLPYDTLQQLRRRLGDASPVFQAVDRLVPAAWAPFGGDGAVDAAAFVSPVANYYMTDPISRASVTMARCTDELLAGKRPVGMAAE